MKKIITFIIPITVLILVYGFFIEPENLQLRKVTIKDSLLYSSFRGLKIAFLSDIHIGDSPGSVSSRAIAIVEKNRPDLILLAGDYVEWFGNRGAYGKAVDFLSKLTAPLGVYAVMGDADYSRSRNSCVFCHNKKNYEMGADHKVTFLRNDILSVKWRDSFIRLVGLDEADDNFEKTFRESCTQGNASIILSHKSAKFSALNCSSPILFLSGDSHGGQVRMPRFFWQIFGRKDDPVHMYGLFKEGKKHLYVTSGVGTSASFPFRIGVFPEIVLLRFEDEDK